MSYHDEELSDKDEEEIAKCLGGMLIYWWLPIPFIAGIMCDIAEKDLIALILKKHGVAQSKASVPGILFRYHFRNPFLWIGTYIPYIGIPCQYIEVRRLTKYTKYLIKNGKLKSNPIGWVVVFLGIAAFIVYRWLR